MDRQSPAGAGRIQPGEIAVRSNKGFRGYTVAFMLLGLLSPPFSIPQSSTPRTADLIIEANKQLRLGRTDSAKALFESALRLDDKSIPARIGLGKAAVQEEQWSDGCDIFTEVLDRDPANLFAQYGAGICYREYGTQVGLFMRNIQWGKATDYFLRVIARDSAFEDVLYQLAVLLRYKKDNQRAFALGHRQSTLRPDMNEASLGLFRIYRSYIAEEDPQEALDSLARMQSDHARFFVGEVLRRQGNLDAAERVFLDLLSTPRQVPSEVIFLSLARVYFEKGQPARGEEIYWRAVDGLSSWLGAALLFEDLKYLVTDSELDVYRSVVSDRKKKAFFHAFWNVRNPAPAARINVRLAEHSRRFQFAERNYESYEFRSWFNDPDKVHHLQFPKSFALNREFNDKGLIYIRHGEPDDTQRTMGLAQQEQHESWLYSATRDSPQRIFHFSQSNSVGNNWRLVSIPDDPKMLEKLETWDIRFHELVSGEPLGREGMVDRLRVESQGTVAAALATDEHRWTKETRTFSLPHSITRFRGDSGMVQVNISYALPILSLKNEFSDTLKSLLVEVGVSVSGQAGEKVGSGLNTYSFSLTPQTGNWYVELSRFVLRPDSVRISMHARPVGANLISTWNTPLRLQAYLPSAPLLSDIEFLLPSTTKSSTEIDGIKVIPCPFDALPRTRPLYVYWEMYNLTKDGDGNTKYKSQLLLTPGDSAPNDESLIVYEKDHAGHDEFASEFAQIDVRKYDEGIYTLTVQITDRLMVYTFSKSRLVKLTEG
jgi:GWxTD domain-containing protein